jgi:co-chaperonin GroES (HSP10)
MSSQVDEGATASDIARARILRGEEEEANRHAAIDAALAGWTPMGDRLAIAKVRPLERLTGAGIVLAGTNSEMGDKVERRGMLARVVAAGPDATLTKDTRVYCANFAGAVLEVNGHAVLIVKEDELLMVESLAAGDEVIGLPSSRPDSR